MIEDLPTSEQKTSKIITQEVIAHLASALLYPFGLRSSKKRTPKQKIQRTVVFVHGYMGNRSSFYPLAVYLRAIGIKQILFFNYPLGVGIEEAAALLREFLRTHVRGGKIELVCHSLGGVISRIYIQELGGDRRVEHCITLGSPHRGTYNSYWVPSRVGRNLRPDSALIKRLEASRGKSAKVKFTSIVGGSDNIVIPRVFAANGEDVVHIPNIGHLGMLFNPTVFQTVAKRLL